MAKQLITNYSLNATNKTITLTDFVTNPVRLERLQLITNVSKNVILYNFGISTSTATVSGNVITLSDIKTTASGDLIQVIYDAQAGDPVYDLFVNSVDMAGNDNAVTQSITAADTGSTNTTGQGGQVLWAGTPTAASTAILAFPLINGFAESQSNTVIYISGTFTGTYVLERSPDNGTTWTAFNCFIAGTPDQVNTGTLPGMFHGNCAGTTRIRVRATALSSGSITAQIRSGIGTGTITVGNPLRIYDGVSKVQASIKAASTAPAATDTALVIATSPNSPEVSSAATTATNTGRIPAQGAATTSASLPVNIASDQQVPVTNGFARQTGLSAAALNADLVASTDVTGYTTASLQLIGTSANLTLTFQVSNDNTNWITWQALSNLTAQWSGTNINPGTGSFSIPLGFRYLRVRITSYTSGSVAGTLELHTLPMQMFGTLASQNGTWNVGLNSGTNSIGTVQPGNTANTTPWLVTTTPTATAGALLSYQAVALTAKADVKTSAGRLHRITVQNPNTSIAWLQIFNATATNVTLGTTTPIMSIPVPTSGIFEDFYMYSDTFSTAISIAPTTTANGSTAVTTGLFVSLGYI